MWDDDDSYKNRFGIPTGTANERVMLDKTEDRDIATVVRTDDTGTTILKKGAGLARFIREESDEVVVVEKRYLFVGEPFYHPEAIPAGYPTTWDAYTLKVNSRATVTATLISDAVYNGNDSTNTYRYYHRQGAWKAAGTNGDSLHFFSSWRDGSRFAEPYLYGNPYSFVAVSINGQSYPDKWVWAYTFATRTMTHNAVTKKWLVCDKGFVADWPTDGAITPFNSGGEVFPSWVNYDPDNNFDPLATWDEWHGLNMAHRFFTDDGKKLVFAAAMPQVNYADQPVFKLPGVYAYDIETNTCETVMHATWNDNTSAFPISVSRLYPLSATGIGGVVRPITMQVDFTTTALGDGWYADAGSYTFKHGEETIYTTTDGGSYQHTGTFVAGRGFYFSGINWVPGYARKFFGYKSVPERGVFFLIELIMVGTTAGTNSAANDLDYLDGYAVIADVSATVHVFDLKNGTQGKKTVAMSTPQRFWPRTTSAFYWANTGSPEVSPTSGETTETFYGYGFKDTATPHDAYYIQRTNPLTMQGDRAFTPFTFSGSRTDAFTSGPGIQLTETDITTGTVFGSVAANSKVALCSVKIPYPPAPNCYRRVKSLSSGGGLGRIECTYTSPYFINVVMNRKTGAVGSFTPDRMYTSLYEFEKNLT